MNDKEITAEFEALQNKNRQLTELIENSKDMLYRMSLPDGKYEYISSACIEIFGHTPEEFYNSPLLLKDILHPESKKYFEEQWPLLLAGKAPPFYEYQIIDSSGRVKWIYQKNVVISDPSGKTAFIEGIVSDVTEQKELEKALKMNASSLLEAQRMAKIGYWYWDIGTGEVEWSEEVFKIFQQDAETFRPQIDSIMALSPWPEDHVREQELIRKAMEKHDTGTYEQRFLLPDGSTGYYLSTFQGIYDDNDILIAMRGTVQDITERKQVEMEKAMLEEQYVQAQKVESIGRLAGGVAHDLNNLLTPIMGYSEMLMEDLASNELYREPLFEIYRAVKRAKNLVGQLLAFSRKQTLRYKIIDVNSILSGIMKLLSHTIREDINLNIIKSPVPQVIEADVGQIEQVIMNLVVNAQDAMPQGGTLTIETAVVIHDADYVKNHFDTEAGAFVMLAISDTGHGMNEETRNRIFEPFFSTKGEMGTGLGLATVYGIIKQHNGDIFVYSEPGIGTTFKIYLPYHGNKQIDSMEEPKEETITRKGSETILLTEDNENVRQMVKKILNRQGYEVIEARNGRDALNLLDSCSSDIHLLLTDVIMPEMNGRDLYNMAREKYPGLKVLYMSGYTDNVIEHYGVLNEGVRFIQKPFSPKDLTAMVREVLSSC